MAARQSPSEQGHPSKEPGMPTPISKGGARQSQAGGYPPIMPTSKSDQKLAKRRLKAIEKQILRAEKLQSSELSVANQSGVSSSLPASSGHLAPQTAEGAAELSSSQTLMSVAETFEDPFACSAPLRWQEPAISGRGPPEASFTPTAAGLRHSEEEEEEGMDIPGKLKNFISEAISKGIEAAWQRQQLPPVPLGEGFPPSSHQSTFQGFSQPGQQPYGHLGGSSESLLGEESHVDLALSDDDENFLPDPPAFSGLFPLALFKPLLHKARATAQIGSDAPTPQKAPQGPEPGLFTAPVTEQDYIPVPDLFLHVVKNQWQQPGVLPTPSFSDKKLYNMGPTLADPLALPLIDEPVAALSSSSSYTSGDAAENLLLRFAGLPQLSPGNCCWSNGTGGHLFTASSHGRIGDVHKAKGDAGSLSPNAVPHWFFGICLLAPLLWVQLHPT